MNPYKNDPRWMISVSITAVFVILPVVFIMNTLWVLLAISASTATTMTRYGIVLQIIGLLSLVPQIISKSSLARILQSAKNHYENVTSGKYSRIVIINTVIFIIISITWIMVTGIYFIYIGETFMAVPYFGMAFVHIIIVIGEILCLNNHDWAGDISWPHNGMLIILIKLLSWYQIPTDQLLVRLTFPFVVVGMVLEFIASYVTNC